MATIPNRDELIRKGKGHRILLTKIKFYDGLISPFKKSFKDIKLNNRQKRRAKLICQWR